MVIHWSDEDQAYLVTLPEWQDRLIGPAVTHGDTYEQAARHGREVLDMLIEDALASGEPLPEPNVHPTAPART
jgi:predicted RNase H-like HicB family nuclease